jgi:hypothetical protein
MNKKQTIAKCEVDDFFDKGGATAMGHIFIHDPETGEVFVNKRNAIHYESFSIAIIKALAQKQDGHIYTMAFGNGASAVSGIGTITYLTPNVVGYGAELYNQTYAKNILEDNMEVRHTPGELYTDLVIRVTLGFGEPSGQRAFDDAISLEDAYVFDEIALKAFDGTLLTHVIFHPVQKSLNRQIELVYTIRVAMV